MKITLQLIFNLAWQKFIVEDAPPAVELITSNDCNYETVIDSKCSYLTTDGRKCAVGLALPDGHPCQGYEGSFDGLMAAYPELFDESILSMPFSDLVDFQSKLHDFNIRHRSNVWAYPVEERRKVYINVAQSFGLKVPE